MKTEANIKKGIAFAILAAALYSINALFQRYYLNLCRLL